MAAAFETPSPEPVSSEDHAEAPLETSPASIDEPRRLPRVECQERSRSWRRHRQLVMRRRR
ncbi:MAG TPA: hypothetical protein VMB50_08000 [Myxococcales bacterium]|nr:hypothetical protein [Myxococcales bacterium]